MSNEETWAKEAKQEALAWIQREHFYVEHAGYEAAALHYKRKLWETQQQVDALKEQVASLVSAFGGRAAMPTDVELNLQQQAKKEVEDAFLNCNIKHYTREEALTWMDIIESIVLKYKRKLWAAKKPPVAWVARTPRGDVYSSYEDGCHILAKERMRDMNFIPVVEPLYARP